MTRIKVGIRNKNRGKKTRTLLRQDYGRIKKLRMGKEINKIMEKKLSVKTIEKQLQDFIDKRKLGGVISVAKVKDWIFNDYGDTAMDSVNRYNKKFLESFVNSFDDDNFDQILELSTNCWNYFSHKSLSGKSPKQVAEKEAKLNNKTDGERNKAMPDVVVGNVKMSWEENQRMLKEMERAQKPFKGQIDKEFLPSYKKFIMEKIDLSEEAKEKYVMVAEKFFDRALWLGFVNYQTIRADFAKYEFPKWWQSHVLFVNYDENQVWLSLRHLISFIKEKYGLEIDSVKD